MRYFIDTDCCIYLFAAANQRLRQRVADTPIGDIGLSAIVLAEFAMGLRLESGEPDPRFAYLIEQMPVQPFDQAAAEAYARIPFRRGQFDRLVAAHALSRNMILITTNERDFADIPHLKVENWTV